MVKALVETTVLTDALLERREVRAAVKAALRRYDETELPAYAIKEFKAGPLRNVVWFYNKLVATGSYAMALHALQRMSLTPRRYTTATALEALKVAAVEFGRMTVGEFTTQNQPDITIDAALCESYRLAIKVNIRRAWRDRRTLTSRIIHELPCYQELAPVQQESGLFEVKPIDCAGGECEMARVLKQDPSVLDRLRAAVDAQPQTRENQRRSQALRFLKRTPKRELPTNLCRALGDAVFAVLCSPETTILTTNMRDIAPLAAALGKRAERPYSE